MIKYHGLPMWSRTAMPKVFAGRHGMVSFADQEQMDIAAEVCASVVLDNGAFSTWKSSHVMDYDGYVEWCKLWLKHPCVEWAVIPDVIEGTEEDNDQYLDRWPSKLNGVPVYHLHESLERLSRLVDRYPRIALGSSGAYSDPGSTPWWTRIAEMMEVICDGGGMPKTKLHGLRMLDPVIFSHIPFASADSCNVSRNTGMDSRWHGPYVPKSRHMRALVLMDRIEAHACASKWSPSTGGVQHNLELLG